MTISTDWGRCLGAGCNIRETCARYLDRDNPQARSCAITLHLYGRSCLSRIPPQDFLLAVPFSGTSRASARASFSNAETRA